MEALPIEQIRSPLVSKAKDCNRIILHAPTGSGKSTQVPQMLLDEGLVPEGKTIIVLQPRRLAARMLAKRVAHERGVRLGDEVGFHIRFDRVFSEATRILFVTEGILMRKMLNDPELSDVGAIVFDEFHERHLYTDLGLALVKRLQNEKRSDLLAVVMSATLDAEGLEAWLAPCQTLATEGRTYPISIEYSAAPAKVADAPIWDKVAHHFSRLAVEHPEGDFLIFMPGSFEIQRTIEAIQAERVARDFVVLPLYGELPPDQQDAAVERHERRKVVVATNVAETSLTIDGVRIVIDSGQARVARFDPHRGINTLLIEKVSQASAAQRSGRAGRTAPGHCLRMWGESEHSHRIPYEIPEIRRIDLSETVLTLKLAGIQNIDTFDWFDAPDAQALQRAVQLLKDLGALQSESGELTPVGRRMAQFPMHPRYARMFLAADELSCVYPVALMAAFTQGRNLLLPLKDRRRREEREELLGDEPSDFFLWLRAWGMARKKGYDFRFCKQWGIHAQAARQAERIADQFLRIAEGQGLDTTQYPLDQDAVRRCLLIGFSDQLALRDSRGTLRCSLVHGRRGELRRESAVRDAMLFVASEVDEIESRGQVNVLLSMATEIEEEWLEELYPDDFYEDSEIVYDPEQRKVIKRYERRFRDLILEQRDRGEPETGEAASLLAEQVATGGLKLKKWDAAVEHWINRINFAAEHCPELSIEKMDQAGRITVLEQICLGAHSFKMIKDREVWPALKEWLSEEQRLALDSFVPPEFVLPQRKRPVKIRYEEGRAIISSKLQDFYDIPASQLTICNGRISLVVELLAPNGRPAQVTEDIDAFWKTSYEGVKKELKGRYPKHEWR